MQMSFDAIQAAILQCQGCQTAEYPSQTLLKIQSYTTMLL